MNALNTLYTITETTSEKLEDLHYELSVMQEILNEKMVNGDSQESIEFFKNEMAEIKNHIKTLNQR